MIGYLRVTFGCKIFTAFTCFLCIGCGIAAAQGTIGLSQLNTVEENFSPEDVPAPPRTPDEVVPYGRDSDAPLPAPRSNGDAYRLGPRDVLSLAVYAGGMKQSEARLVVDEYGEVNVPLLGTMQAEGLTVRDLKTNIYEPLAQDFFVNPEIILYIQEYHSLRNYITGAVASPGLYEAQAVQTVLKLIAKAGGVTEHRADVAYILRNSTAQVQEGKDVEHLMEETETVGVDLVRLLNEGDMGQNLTLQSGDVLYIPEVEQYSSTETIFIEGEVKRPGEYPYKTGMTALNACIIAGGFNKFAAPNRTRIVRKGSDGEKQVIIKIDLTDVIDGDVPDVELEPGDIVSVPESWF